jgi:DNA replication initiation complex subunit (GINS family)
MALFDIPGFDLIDILNVIPGRMGKDVDPPSYEKATNKNPLGLSPDEMKIFRDVTGTKFEELMDIIRKKLDKSETPKTGTESKAAEEAEEIAKLIKQSVGAGGEGGIDSTAKTLIEYEKRKNRLALKRLNPTNVDVSAALREGREQRQLRQARLSATLDQGALYKSARLNNQNQRN